MAAQLTTQAQRPRPIAIAPAVKETPKSQQDAAAASPPTMLCSCVTCARRKVKCDKTGPPCSGCRKGRLECHYQAPAPRTRKRKSIDDVHARLEEYKGFLKQHGLLPQTEKTSPAQSTPSGSDERIPASNGAPLQLQAASGPRPHTGRLLSGRGKSRYIDSTVWRNLNDEGDLAASSDGDDLEAESGASPAAYRRYTLHDPLTGSFLGVSSGESLLNYHPTYDTAMKLWKVYCSHVEPVVKLLHLPTAIPMVQRAASNPSSATKAQEALLFAVYHFAAVAMNDEECRELLAQPREQLQRDYYASVTQALANTSFLRTTDIMVLQAYIMFLLSVRNRYDPHTFWVLTGVAVRIAQRIGLHHDGDDLGLKPFDVQMRRRIFWQILPMDSIAAQLSGTGIAMPSNSWNTQVPLNINDDDIWPEMSEPPVERVGATDMFFCLLRTTVGRFYQKALPWHLTGGGHIINTPWSRLWEAGDLAPIEEVEKAIAELEETVESRFLRYCDPFNSLHLLAMFMGRVGLSNARLRVRLPRARNRGVTISDVERRDIWNLALRIVDGDIACHTNPLIKKFGWHTQPMFQFDPMIVILNELRRGYSNIVTDPEDIWRKVREVYACHPTFLLQKRALHVAIFKLTLKAWDEQPKGWKPGDGSEPAFISKLRAVVNKRHAAAANGASSTTEPSPISNPWQPTAAVDDLNTPMPAVIAPAGSTAFVDMGNILDDFNPDAIDWDTLVSETGGFPPSG